MNERRSVVIGTSGHIDHGKTALVRALTGTDTDRLPEEKQRGITIDLGFASLKDGITDISFVDVPGHHAFVRNMLAGAGGIDAVMLVISAEEGVKPQTEEHLAICTMLGVTRGLTVLTKADMVGEERLLQVEAEVAAWLAGTFLAGQPVIPVSALSGHGLTELQAQLTRLAAMVPARSSHSVARLPIDRAFAVKGFGAVVTGTMHGGAIERGAALVLEPGRREARVRGIQTHGREEQRGVAGSRTALNLAGISVHEIHRGHTAVLPDTVRAVETVDVELALLPGAPELKHRARVRLHAFASEALATVSLYDYQPIQGGGMASARLRLAKPLLLLPGDRFVVRQCSPAMTIGGGRVLDAYPLPKLKKAHCLHWLERLRHATPEQQLMLRVERRGASGISLQKLVAETGLTTGALHSLAAAALASGALVAPSHDHLLSRESLEEIRKVLLTRTSAPVKRAELRSQLDLEEMPFTFALEGLIREKKLEAKGELVAPPGAAGRLPERDMERMAQIERVYAAAGLATPLVREVGEQLKIGTSDLRRLVTLLLRESRLVKLAGEDLFAHREALAELRAKVRALRGQHLDVARFKTLTGLSRKYAIPLLEHLDREQVTRRQGESRIVL